MTPAPTPTSIASRENYFVGFSALRTIVVTVVHLQSEESVMAAQFVVFEDKGMFRWYLKADNGNVIVRHEHAYTSREEAETAIQSVIDNVPNATLVDDGEPPDDDETAEARRIAEYHAIAVKNQEKIKKLAAKFKVRIVREDGSTLPR
jgi:uncharacterized protein YegP (UPF0339 family)